MKKTERELTFGAFKTMTQHRGQLERKLQEIRRMLAGRDTPILPENWTDEDAWQLARTLAQMMGQLKRINLTLFDEQNPYPSRDTLLLDIPYYNPILAELGEDPATPPEIPLELWAEVLHCGILVAAAKPKFCFFSNGTFSDLEELFLGTVRSGGGPVPLFGYVLDLLGETLSEDHYQTLKKYDFGPEPPRFDPPKSDIEESYQAGIAESWEEWNWLSHFSYRDALLQSIDRIQSDDRYSCAINFIAQEIGLSDRLCQAIDLYLFQDGVSGMLEESYYVTYAMLCRTQKQIKAAMTAEES